MHCFKSPLPLITILFLLIASVYGDGDEKSCAPCTQSPPPPSPPPPTPSPPPPSPSSLCPPPPSQSSQPSPKKPPSSTPYGPPPPSNMIYITGPPGELYPVDQNFNGATRSLASGLPIILVGLLGPLAFW